MKKKLLIALCIAGVITALVIGINVMMPKPVAGAKAIEVVIMDEMAGKELYSGTLHTDALTMYELLVEKTELKVVMESSQYGNFIVSMIDVSQGDIAKGPWWLYESENNESCITAGMCPGVDDMNINDGDRFVFMLTDTFE